MTKLLPIMMVMGLMGGCGKEVKVWEEEYSKDEVKEEYQYYHHPKTNRRIKDGWYRSYHKNGEHKKIGTYKDNERDGKWSFFTDYGTETKGIYKEGKKWSGEFVLYYESGKVRYEENYVNGRRKGKSVFYDESGKVRYEENYVDGKREGKEVLYYESGTVKQELNYVSGKKRAKRLPITRVGTWIVK